MRSRRIFAVVAGAAMTVTAAVAFVPSSMAAGPSANAVPLVVCAAPTWTEGPTYQAGAQVTYSGRLYQALVTHTAHPGAGWNPASTPSLWRDLGACSGTTPPPTTPPPTTPPPTT
ncbi:carbohydrate-binding protein, partial [Micromonospora arida]